mgnify:CR=1 FL=1
MSIREVKAFFAARGMEDRVLEFETSSATVELAAHTVGVIPARIAKTLSFLTAQGPLLVVTAGDAKIDNHKFKETFGCKAKMLSPEEVVEYTGHAIGGVCAFAIENPKVKVYCDESLRRFDTVFPACGTANSAIEVSCDELFEFSRALEWVDVTKLPEVSE